MNVASVRWQGATMEFLARQASRCGPLPRTLLRGFQIVLNLRAFALTRNGVRRTKSPVNGGAGHWVCLQRLCAWFDTRTISLYSTKTRWTAACKWRPAGKGFNGLYVHSRDLYVLLLSGRRRAGMFDGLDSEDETSEHQRPTAPHGAVGLCF
jgi:hypothetical protein